MPVERSRRWRLVRLIAVQLAVTIALVWLVLEGWARLFPPKDQTIWPLVQDPALGSRFQANSRVVLSNGLDFSVEERSNEAGFLDRPLPPVARPPGTCRIAIVGDSFVEAAQVPIRQKVQVEIERLASERRLGRRLETMAFGFSGTGQLNQLGYVDAHVSPRRPDLTVLVFVSNDFANNSALLEAVRNGWHPAHTPRIFARESATGAIELQPISSEWLERRLPAALDERPWLHRRLHRASRFYRWLYAKLTLQYPAIAQWLGHEPTEAARTRARIAALNAIDERYGRLLAGWDPERSPSIDGMFQEPDPLPGAFRQALAFTQFALDQHLLRARAVGGRLAVIGSHELAGNPEARLRSMLDARSIPFISLRDHIARRGASIAEAQWRHDAHWSPKGHAWAAEAILDHIEREGICNMP